MPTPVTAPSAPAATTPAVSGAADGFSYSLSTGYGQSHGFNATNRRSFSYNPDKDSYYQNYATGTLGLRMAARAESGGAGLPQPHQRRLRRPRPHYDYNDRYIRDRRPIRWPAEPPDPLLEEHAARRLYGGQRTIRAPKACSNNNTRFPDPPDASTCGRNDFTLAAGQRTAWPTTPGPARRRADRHPTGIGNYSGTRRHVNSYTGVYLGDFVPP